VFKGEIITKNAKIRLGHLKIFSNKTTVPILTKHGTNHLWGEGIQVYSNEGEFLSPRGGNSTRVKIHQKN
jgi:hypothetical protein